MLEKNPGLHIAVKSAVSQCEMITVTSVGKVRHGCHVQRFVSYEREVILFSPSMILILQDGHRKNIIKLNRFEKIKIVIPIYCKGIAIE